MNKEKKKWDKHWLDGGVKEKIILSFCKNGKKDFLKDFCNRDIAKPLKEIAFNSQYVNGNWGFIAEEQSEVVSGWKIIKRTNQG